MPCRLFIHPRTLLHRTAGVQATSQRGIPSVSHTYRRLCMVNFQPIEIPLGDSYHQATICLKRHGVYTIIFRHQAGVVSQEAATSLRGSAPVSEALVSDKKLLSLLSPVTPVMSPCRPPWGLLPRSSTTTEMARGPRVNGHKLTHCSATRNVPLCWEAHSPQRRRSQISTCVQVLDKPFQWDG